MGGHHNHNGCAGHAHGEANTKRLKLTLIITASYMIVEVIGGILTNSLALLADAGHMLSDAGALGLSLFAIWLARRPPTPERTFGYFRTEILAALANGVVLVAIAINIFIEAYKRIGAPPEVRGELMIGVATIGLFVNIAGLMILHKGRSESLNVRGAWLHVFTDALGSIGAMISGILIWRLGWNMADPIASVIIGILVLYSSWGLLKETLGVLMEGTPKHIDIEKLRCTLSDVPGVIQVHDLHVWTITSGKEALSVHVLADKDSSRQNILKKMKALLLRDFGIDHITIQIETELLDDGAEPF